MSQIDLSAPTLDAVDWQHWIDRWDRQQAGYLPDREALFDLMLTAVARLAGPPRRILDLCCGPGSISARAAARFPDAEIVALDLDPFLLELGRRTVCSSRVTFVEADLRVPGWDAVLGDEPLDAVCSATALHYLEVAEVDALAAVLAERIRPGGVFLNADTLRLGSAVPRLDELAAALRQQIWDGSHARGIEDWRSWWDAAREEPAFADLLAERDARMILSRRGPEVNLPAITAAFHAAGFTETATLHQTADKHLFTALH